MQPRDRPGSRAGADRVDRRRGRSASPTRSSPTAATRPRSRCRCSTGSPDRPDGKLVCVTGMTPTKAGEGKTTTLVGLTQGLGRDRQEPGGLPARGRRVGPVFGIKGGAAGGGMTQVVPMEDLNLHFTGDIHAIGAANNLLAAMIDASILHGNPHKIDALRIGWRRAVDMNDRALRQIAVGLGGRANGYPRETGFDITAASEVMAIMAVSARPPGPAPADRARSPPPTRSTARKPITAEDLGAAGAMTVLLKDAIKPNLVQTLEGQPVLMHCGPFANIAHGNNSLIADLIGMKLGDYVVTESGFGSDMGMEKFFDIVCRFGKLTPSAAVLVTHRARDQAPRRDRRRSRASTARRACTRSRSGFANVRRHLEHRPRPSACPRVVGRQPPPRRHQRGGRARQAARAGGRRLRRRDQRRLHPGRRRRRRPGRGRGRGLRAAQHASTSSTRTTSRSRTRSRRSPSGSTAPATSSSTPRPRPRSASSPREGLGALPDLHGQDPPVAVRRPAAAQCARELHPAGARHPRLHRAPAGSSPLCGDITQMPGLGKTPAALNIDIDAEAARSGCSR